MEFLDQGKILPDLLHLVLAERDLAGDQLDRHLDTGNLVTGQKHLAHPAPTEIVRYLIPVIRTDAHSDTDVLNTPPGRLSRPRSSPVLDSRS